MNNFVFQNPTKIIFGKGQITTLAAEIHQSARILLTFGGGSVKQNGVYQQVTEALQNHHTGEFWGIEPNPTYETLMKAVTKIREEGFDYLLAVGGGSVIDGTKFLAAAAVYQGEPWEILTRQGSGIREALPFGTVLTLPATGSEMNMGSVITRKETKDKLAFLHPSVYPKFSILDPETTFTLPPRQIANGVVDAFTHIMEQYMTYPAGGHVQDRLAEGLLLTLVDQGPKAMANPKDYEVRSNIMWAATLALNGLIGSGVPQDWSTHMLGHEITALHGLDHAQTLAIVLPSMLEVRQESKKDKLIQYGERVFGIREGNDSLRITKTIEATRSFFESLGVKTRLSDYDISPEAIPALLNHLKRHGMTALGEHQDVTPEISRKVLETSL